MTDLRFHIDLIERAQAGTLDEASPFRHALAGALAAGVAFGAAKPGVADPMSPPTASAPEPDRTRPEPPRSALTPATAPTRPRARPSASGTPEPAPGHLGPTDEPEAASAALGGQDEPIRPKPRPVTGKQGFVADMLPRIAQENEAILMARRNVERLTKRMNLTPKQRAYLDRQMATYEVDDPDDFAELLNRMNTIPPSLVLAQAALESGWGSSRLAQQGNVLFGQKTTGNRSVNALGDGTRYAAFDSRNGSIRSYMRNLNTQPSYDEFRAARAALARDGEGFSGLDLAQYLERYSTRGEDYIADVVDMIRSNHFDRHDQPSKTAAVRR